MDVDNYNDVKRIAGDKWNPGKVDLLLNEVYPSENINVPDPYYGVESDYISVYEMIDKACEKIVEAPTKR
jgi:protein-tyrosine phosphatase